MSALPRRTGWLLALAATFTMAVSYIDRQSLSVLAPTVCAALHISDTGYGVVTSAFSLAYLVGAPLAGRWIDRVGARRGLLASVLVWTVVSALHGAVPGFAVLVALRVALGFAESPSFPGAAQTVHRALSPADRPRGFGLLFTGSSLGAMITPTLAVAIQQRFGWRAAMLLTPVAGLVWVPLWLALSSRGAARDVLDTRPEAPVDAPDVDEPPVWRSPALRRGLVLIVASAPAIAFNLLWGSKFLVRGLHVPQSQVDRYLWLPLLMFDLGSVAFGDLAARFAKSPRNPRGGTLPALVALAGVLELFAAAMPWGGSPWGCVALAGVCMVGGGGLFSMLTSDLMARVSPRQVSTAGGLCAAAQSVAYVIANPLIGRSVDHTHGFTVALTALGLWVIPGVLAWIVWPDVPPVRSTERFVETSPKGLSSNRS